MSPRCVDALGVAIGVPEGVGSEFDVFPEARRAPDVVLAGAERAAVWAEFTRAAVDRTSLVCLHAGVVHGPQGAIVFPGASGMGKSTLTVALMRAGLGYMSDEVLAIDPGTDEVIAFPRPVSLDRGSVDLLGLDPHPAAWRDGEVQLRAADLGPLGPPRARLAAILLVDRHTSAAASASPGSPAAAFGRLMSQSFNHYRLPQPTFATLSRIVREVAIHQVGYGNAVAAAQLVAEGLGR